MLDACLWIPDNMIISLFFCPASIIAERRRATKHVPVQVKETSLRK